MNEFLRDMRQAGRRLGRAPGFTLVTMATLGLGIGACTAMYTVVHGVLLRALPYPAPERMVHLWQVNARGIQTNFSDPNYEDVRDGARSFTAMAQYAQRTTSVVGGAAPVRADVASVSGGFFDVFLTQPVIGRLFAPDEQRLGGAPAVLVSHAFWQRSLRGTRDLTGQTLTFGQRAYAVIGVLPPTFRFPAGVDLWTARELEERLPSRTAHNWRVVGRLGDGVALAQARDDVRTLARRLRTEHGERTWMVDAAVVPLRDELVGSARPVLLLLLAAVVFLLLVASANVVNLLLARAASSQREAAVRAALGASRVQQIRPFLAESIVLVAVGCALGLLVATVAVRGLLALDPSGVPRLHEVRLGWPVLALACAISAALGIIMGLCAGWRAMRLDPYAWLKGGQLTQTGGGSGARLRDALVVVQLAVSLMLLVGAGLLARSFQRLLAQEPGFRTSRILTMELASPHADGAIAETRLVRLHEEIVARARMLPGVIDAGGVDALPMNGGGADGMFIIVDGEPPTTFEEFERLAQNKELTGFAEFRAASPGYFRAMGIPLARGRWFDDRDTIETPHVAVISDSLAKTRWPDRDPIGLRIEFGNMDGDVRLITIVGIVGDIRHRGLDSPPQPTFYVNASQRPGKTANFTVAIHATTDPAWLVDRMREIVRALEPEVVPRVRTIEQVLDATLASRRYSLWLVAAFALAAAVLAVVGIYGVVSYAVAQRTREFGVRMALGARPVQLIALVLGQGARLIVAGLLLGSAGGCRLPNSRPPRVARGSTGGPTVALILLRRRWRRVLPVGFDVAGKAAKRNYVPGVGFASPYDTHVSASHPHKGSDDRMGSKSGSRSTRTRVSAGSRWPASTRSGSASSARPRSACIEAM
jgi:putative ABC transport system permease protein